DYTKILVIRLSGAVFQSFENYFDALKAYETQKDLDEVELLWYDPTDPDEFAVEPPGTPSEDSGSVLDQPVISTIGDSFDFDTRIQTGPMKKSRKKQTNTTSARLREFLPFHDSTLEELIRLDGAGDFLGKMVCSTCTEEGSTRCLTCFMAAPQCGGCLVAAHRNTPLHRVEPLSPEPLAGPPNFVVFDVDMAHPVAIDYCDCDSHPQNFTPKRVQLLRARWFPATYERPQTVFTFACLEFFHELSLQSKTTLYDYYHTLLRRTDNVKLYKQISRYPEFHRVFRIWQHLTMLKRAGIGHNPQGAAATSEGSAALECPACPHPARNLPDDWQNAPVETRWIYALLLALDANFKLKSKTRGIKDVELGPGWSYFVAEEPYQKHLANYVSQPEINTCRNDHDAILRVNTRNTPGFNVSGTVLVICARHAFVRKNGAGDLQKGERYCNVDYVVLSTLIGVHALLLVLSYDIACQWLKRLSTRIKAYPPTMHIPSPTKILGVVPRWHIEGHDQDCQSSYSFNYTRGVGKTCGEDIESTWSVSNQLCGSIREMGPGADILSDHWGWNFQKLRWTLSSPPL
ncbi:hypothetical protein HGRIS_010475, partial [Hohenbuehelia grisea]